jgi:crotonobetainyl-CoA:carnitine CoA-transferase CaiB-like acyl-CoA transferase
LVQRALTGKSAVVDGSLMGTAVWFNGPAINGAASGQPSGGGGGSRADRNPQVNIYKTKDSRWINLCMLSGDRDWHDLVKHLGKPELASDPRFAKADDRSKHHREAVAILDQVFAQRTLKEWQEILKTTLGVWEPVQTPDDIHQDVQTIANGFVRKAKYPDGSELPLVVPGVLFDQDSGEPMPAPEWGQHTEQVLGELGMTSAHIAQLRLQGVIR